MSKYGIVAGTEVEPNLVKVDGLVEKPKQGLAPSNLAVLGRYILPPEIFDALGETKPGAGNEIQLTDAIAALHNPIYALAYEGKRYDIGDRMGYLKATVEFGLRNDLVKDEFRDYLKGLE